MTTASYIANNALLSSSDVVSNPIPDSSGALSVSEADPWSDITDTLLDWHRDQENIAPDCLDSAIDFAIDQRDEKASPPSSIIATEDGEITFEWRMGRSLIIITVLASGLAEYTKFRDCQVIEEWLLRRDPRTRKLQLEDM